MRDVMKALKLMVLDESTITDLVGARVYVNRLPRALIEAEDTHHPQKMLVLRQAGGPGDASMLPVVNQNFTVLCYGETDLAAEQVRLAVFELFRYVARATYGDVLIHHINNTGGPLPALDPDLQWPAVAQGFTTLADVMEAA